MVKSSHHWVDAPMKISVNELSKAGRWSLLLLPATLVAFLAALFAFGANGQSRLEAATVRMHGAEIRAQALDDYLELVVAAEAGEREYQAHPSAPGTPMLDHRVSSEIVTRVNALRRTEIAELSVAAAGWQSDLRLAHSVMMVGAILNIGLVLVATGLVYADRVKNARQAGALTRELTTLSTHLQGISEQEKSALSRELHDELGGLLVAARMDLSWLQNRLPTSDPAIAQRFMRIHESLSAGVDLKRRVVEELRPTLLDNMGLFTALRWQFKESCRRAGLNCTESIPIEDRNFDPDAAIGIFRIAQEALTNILKHAEAHSADLAVELQSDVLILRVSDDGIGIPTHRLTTSTSHGLASMRHRIHALGGTLSLQTPPGGGTVMTARFPLSKVLPAERAIPAVA